MRAVLQKVTCARVDVVDNESRETAGSIGHGLLVLLGIAAGDSREDARYIADKIAHLRIFEDDGGKLNLSVRDIGGAVLLVSQFTLLADARSGRRPSYSRAAAPEDAEPLCRQTADYLRAHGLHVENGRFRSHMQVSLCNDGPVTILLDSQKTF